MPTPDLKARGADPSPPSLSIHLVLFIVQASFATLAVEGKVARGPVHHVSPPALAMARILGGAAVFIGAHLALRTPRVLHSGTWPSSRC